jgi:Holliday junction resolvase RusA-like endonuclease
MTTSDLMKRVKQHVKEDKAYKSTSKHIDAALKSLFKAGFTKDDSLVEALEKAKKYIP